MEAGWRAREDHNFDAAETLLNQAKEIFEQEEDWFNFTECLNHLAYTYKLKAMQNSDRAIELAKESMEMAGEKKTKRLHALRALISAYETAGLFEPCINLAKEYIELQDNTAAKADMQSHLATFLMRTGNINGGLEMVETSLQNLERGGDSGRDPHKSIWKTRALKEQALILHNLGRTQEATEKVEQALKIAKEKDLKTRMSQLETIKHIINKTDGWK